MNHAYAHWVGRTVGLNIGEGRIVAATVRTPEPGLDHNLIQVTTVDGTWHTVRAMETHRADFVNHAIEDGAPLMIVPNEPNEALGVLRARAADAGDAEWAAFFWELDWWLSTGGYLPDAWAGDREGPGVSPCADLTAGELAELMEPITKEYDR